MDPSMETPNARFSPRATPTAPAALGSSPEASNKHEIDSTGENSGNPSKHMGRKHRRYFDGYFPRAINLAAENSIPTNRCSGQLLDQRSQAEEQAAKRRKLETDGSRAPVYGVQFSQEDIDADKRRPKKKVAVLMGYSGTGYYGMQLNPRDKTIEGDLFSAMVAARAISKANAMDPKKSSLVRCARTDKGVHAAGNVVSMKLIIEDEDIVAKINEQLNPQIRIWGIVPVTGGFSAYRFCDSRIYEYLIPSHSFLPPHPSTFLARQLVKEATEHNDMEAYRLRQEEVISFWEETDRKYVDPAIDNLPESIREYVRQAVKLGSSQRPLGESLIKCRDKQETAGEPAQSEDATNSTEQPQPEKPNFSDEEQALVDQAVRDIRTIYFKAKKEYRIDPKRLARVNEALNLYVGTRNFYNYTIQKTYRDPSAKRVIRSFKISKDPIVIDGTEWLSLKVHGQSFMMHQIRKMVAMATLLIRCGCDLQRIVESYGPTRIPIPKAPGLGLLLERPIFDGYNLKADELGRDHIDFAKYESEIDDFKMKNIYQHIYRQEKENDAFGNFFNHVDSFKGEEFRYLTSAGMPAQASTDGNKQDKQKDSKAMKAESKLLAEVESESESEIMNNGEEGG
ncbi:tRNA pseudouridine synthase 1 [Myotisia sp. PD_48]|nr:tRNA pseudouridine synthase 1 [Myotisia sp. PD_48]